MTLVTSSPGRLGPFCLNVPPLDTACEGSPMTCDSLRLPLSVSTVSPRLLHAGAPVSAPSLTLPERPRGPLPTRGTSTVSTLGDCEHLRTALGDACLRFSWARPGSGTAGRVFTSKELCIARRSWPHRLAPPGHEGSRFSGPLQHCYSLCFGYRHSKGRDAISFPNTAQRNPSVAT